MLSFATVGGLIPIQPGSVRYLYFLVVSSFIPHLYMCSTEIVCLFFFFFSPSFPNSLWFQKLMLEWRSCGKQLTMWSSKAKCWRYFSPGCVYFCSILCSISASAYLCYFYQMIRIPSKMNFFFKSSFSDMLIWLTPAMQFWFFNFTFKVFAV